MAQIKRLSPATIQKIAAGEVVERPASVVKELVENALDAGATQIYVKVEDSSSFSISVRDNGHGMSKEDLLLSIEPHTTSKIMDFSDLLKVNSYGFRGEALASIAGVSRLTIKTLKPSQEEGWVLQDGQISKAVLAPGTLVEVNDLFYNTPARKKFLKSKTTEKGFLSQVVEEAALSQPHVAFHLEYNDRKVISYGASQLENRIKAVFHKRWFVDSERFFVVEDTFKGVRLWALCSEPSLVVPSAKHLYFFVNKRAIKDKTLMHAVKHAYGSVAERGRWPYIVLFFDLPGEDVDVNVHPTKKEVRFRDNAFVHQWVSSVLKKGIQEQQGKYSFAPVIQREAQSADRRIDIKNSEYRGGVYPELLRRAPALDDEKNLSSDKKENSLFEKKSFSELHILGQVKNSYIVCEGKDRMILIDQHAAHERVAFEKIVEAFQKSEIEKQYLLVPEQVELSEAEVGVFEKWYNLFKKIGFELSLYSGQTLIIQAVPLLAKAAHPRSLIHEILAELEDVPVEKDPPNTLPEYLHRLFATIACHSVIRANHLLTKEEMEALLKQLDYLEFTQCPHGRPVAIHFPFSDLEKRFKRT